MGSSLTGFRDCSLDAVNAVAREEVIGVPLIDSLGRSVELVVRRECREADGDPPQSERANVRV